jgi:ferredoxin
MDNNPLYFLIPVVGIMTLVVVEKRPLRGFSLGSVLGGLEEGSHFFNSIGWLLRDLIGMAQLARHWLTASTKRLPSSSSIHSLAGTAGTPSALLPTAVSPSRHVAVTIPKCYFAKNAADSAARKARGGRAFSGDSSPKNSGEKVHFIFVEGKTGEKIDVSAVEGKTMLETAIDHNIDIEGACGGELACSTCHVIVPKGLYDKLPVKTEEEQDMLDLAWGVQDT